MPVQYSLGVLKEHLHARAAAGLFDVSHMGQIALRAKSGDGRDASRALERLVPVDMIGLAPGRLRYAFFTNVLGGILDDLMVGNWGDHLVLVVNAACKEADEAHLRAELGDECDVEQTRSSADRASGAESGSGARGARTRVHEHAVHGCANADPDGRRMHRYAIRLHRGRRIRNFNSRRHRSRDRGGIDSQIQALHRSDLARGIRFAWKPDYAFMAQTSTRARRRSKRDCHGPSRKSRRRRGAREGNFPGAEIILGQLEHGALRRRVGLAARGTGTCARWRIALCGRGRRRTNRSGNLRWLRSESSTPRLQWAICQPRSQCPAQESSPSCAASACLSASRRSHSSYRNTNAAEPPDTWRMPC